MSPPRSLPASAIEPLTVLSTRVTDFADLCEPDHLCVLPALHDELKFRVLDLEEHSSAIGGEHISLVLNGKDHLFTDWSRKQMLDHLGTREKWFKRVMLEDQARELQRRIHTFDRHRFRVMRTYEDSLRIVRGLVSDSYAEIPDVEVMGALCAAMPDGGCLKQQSGKSDKAFYVYAVEPNQALGLGQNMTGYPGALIKNSEVGATALWVIPYFVVQLPSGSLAPIALKRQALLRRIHRGQYADLKAALADALKELQAVWAPLQKRLDGLLAKSFPSEDAALDRLHAILTSMKRPKSFILTATTTYRAAKNTAHNGLTLFIAVLSACATNELDQRYDDAEIAGYLLLQLV